MTQSITVYPTDTPGLYRTEGGQAAAQFSIEAYEIYYCVHCLQNLSAPADGHWQIETDIYCHRCVVVADEEEGP